MQIFIQWIAQNFGEIVLLAVKCQEVMKLVDSHGSSLLLFMMKVMVGYFVSDTHKVITVFILVMLVLVLLELTEQ